MGEIEIQTVTNGIQRDARKPRVNIDHRRRVASFDNNIVPFSRGLDVPYKRKQSVQLETKSRKNVQSSIRLAFWAVCINRGTNSLSAPCEKPGSKILRWRTWSLPSRESFQMADLEVCVYPVPSTARRLGPVSKWKTNAESFLWKVYPQVLRTY
jgi:hypothetical protein